MRGHEVELTAERRVILVQEHRQNTPRMHDHHGHRVDEPVQCRKCLQLWPCDIINLLNKIEELEAK